MADTGVKTREQHEEWLNSIESISNHLLRDTLHLFASLHREEAAFVDYARFVNVMIYDPERILQIQLKLIEEIHRRSTFISSASADLHAYMLARAEEPGFWDSPSRPSAQRTSDPK
jgi:hypothetical protein